MCGRIHEVKKLTNDGFVAKVGIKAFESRDGVEESINLTADTDVRKTLLNKSDWNKIKASAALVKT